MERDMTLEGRTALVTGSGRNIGRAVALEFADHGANIILNARSNKEEINEVAEEVRSRGVGAYVVLGDAAEKNTVTEFQRVAAQAKLDVDVYVSNAARRLHRDFFDTTDEDWHRYLNQQLTASWYLAKAFVPGMRDRGWGRAIHMNGPDGWRGGATRIPHSTAKGGLRAFTKSLAASVGRYGITVNDVNPGFNNTERDPETHPGITPERSAEIARERIPIRRQPTPEEVAWACLFLASDRSGAVTGTAIHVDGGMWMLG